MKKNYYSLFEGRHQLPKNNGAIFSSFDFENFIPIFSNLGEDLFTNLGKGSVCYVYVTGLTPALCYLLQCFFDIKKEQGGEGELRLLHFDKNSLDYKECGVYK